MVFSNSKFDSLTARPPTPPKDIERGISEALDFFNDPFGADDLLNNTSRRKPFVDTPPKSSPTSSAEKGSGSGSGRRRKRVNFDASICNITPTGLTPHQWTPLRDSALRPLPQTRINKPLKSILKPHDPSSILLQALDPTSPHPAASASKFETFAEMLESMVKLLAQDSRPSRLDAYISLQSTLKAYENVPDTKSLVDKLGLLSQFIRRDMIARSPTGTGLDSQLVVQALKFLLAIVRIPAVKEALDEETCSFILERIIEVCENANAPKTVVNTHLAVLMQQQFRPRSMTSIRVQRIIDSLQDIDERVTGFGVQAYRLRCYKRLIDQAPTIMLVNTSKWFEIIFKSMLSKQKDIKQAAIDAAQAAAKKFAQENKVTKAVLAFLNTTRPDGETNCSYLCKRLRIALDENDEPSLVPQIWGALTAFLRNHMLAPHFIGLQEWLALFAERFLSSNDAQMVFQTNIAFNILVYSFNPNRTTALASCQMLKVIAKNQLHRKSRFVKQQTEFSNACYYAVLYYAFRPTASAEELNRFWEEYVSRFWNDSLYTSSKLANSACHTVSALFGRSESKIWNEGRALELRPRPLVSFNELPILDPKWVRKQIACILKFVEKCLDAAPWTHNTMEEVPVKRLWIRLMDSLVDASSKEVKASSETKDAVAHILKMLRRLWDRHTSEPVVQEQEEDDWADKFGFLIETAVQKLGAMQFADKFLSQNGSEDFEVAPTPSHRSRHYGAVISPLVYLVDLMINRSEGKLSDVHRLDLVEITLEPCWVSRNTRLSKLELLQDCSEITKSSAQSAVVSSVWYHIASLTKATLQENSTDATERQSQHLGEEYEAVVNILCLGLDNSITESMSISKELLTLLVDTVKKEAGDGAMVLAVIERLSELMRGSIQSQQLAPRMSLVSILLENLPQSISRRAIEQGRKSLWTTSAVPPRSPDFDPYSHLYKAVVELTALAYHTFSTVDGTMLKHFFQALTMSIQQCPISLLGIYLRKIQNGMGVWIEDVEGKLQAQHPRVEEVYREILSLWQTINDAIERFPRKDSLLLVALEPLISSGFLSRRRGIVNISIETWNRTFGREETLQYPPCLESALHSLRTVVDLQLPTFATTEQEVSHPTFYESPDEGVNTPVAKHNFFTTQRSPFLSVRNASARRSPARTNQNNRTGVSHPSPRVRLRHDDSQIHFEPITSSPGSPTEQESQIMTERQQEQVEQKRRQAQENALYSDIRSSPTTRKRNLALPTVSLSSDDIAGDDSMEEGSRTPLRALSTLGPMDCYLGSSPTPHARLWNRSLGSDKTGSSTPTAFHTANLAEDDEDLPSSPPRPSDALLHMTNSLNTTKTPDVVRDSFKQHRTSNQNDKNPDPDVIVEENDELPQPGNLTCDDRSQIAYDELPTEDESEAVAPSTVDVQLTAQIAAEMHPQSSSASTSQIADTQQTSNDVFVDALSAKPIVDSGGDVGSFVEITHTHTENGGGNSEIQQHPEDSSEIAETQIAQNAQCPDALRLTSSQEKNEQTDSTDVSRVGDSFASGNHAASTNQRLFQPKNIHRPTRTSVSKSPGRHASLRKRKESPTTNTNEAKKAKKETNKPKKVLNVLSTSQEDDDLLDCIVVSMKSTTSSSLDNAASKVKSTRTSSAAGIVEESAAKRQSMTSIPAKRQPGRPPKRVSKTQSTQEEPASSAKRTTRASAAGLRQSLFVDDVILVEDTPAPKRQRTGASQDVSDAGSSGSTESRFKRLSHVQVTPKGSKSRTSTPHEPSVPVSANEDTHVETADQTQNEAVVVNEPQLQDDTTAPLETAEGQLQDEARTPRRPNAERASTTPAGRSILTPRSIISRLKKMITDCSQLVLGSQEARQIDDALYDLRTEVFEARRRGTGAD